MSGARFHKLWHRLRHPDLRDVNWRAWGYRGLMVRSLPFIRCASGLNVSKRQSTSPALCIYSRTESDGHILCVPHSDPHLLLQASRSGIQVYGPSMLPTMSVQGELVWESRLINPERLKRGDLVTVVSPLDPGRVICKRLIGLPGDVICVDPTGQLAPSTEHVVIPRGHIWISGDNAAESRDSRQYGPVSMALVKGKLVARVRNAL